MLLVKTYVASSPIHGIGLFAAQFIPKGTIVWRLDKEFDRVFDQAALEVCNPVYREFVLRYGYKSKYTGSIVLCLDNGRFMNHSDNPSLIEVPHLDDGLDIAAEDLGIGHELTADYSKWDEWWQDKLGS